CEQEVKKVYGMHSSPPKNEIGQRMEKGLVYLAVAIVHRFSVSTRGLVDVRIYDFIILFSWLKIVVLSILSFSVFCYALEKISPGTFSGSEGLSDFFAYNFGVFVKIGISEIHPSSDVAFKLEAMASIFSWVILVVLAFIFPASFRDRRHQEFLSFSNAI